MESSSNTLIQEASYFNNMKSSLKYKMLSWLQRARKDVQFKVLHIFFSVWFGLVWFGLVWFGLVWFGLVWFGLVWFVSCYFSFSFFFCFVI
jgi:hypothetical protein